MQYQRKSYLDYIRFLAVFLVLYGHFISVGTYATSIPTVIATSNENKLPIIPANTHVMWNLETFILNKFHIQTAIVGVVLFMILTGYLSINSREKGTGKEFIIKRIIRLLPVLFISTFITGIILYLHQGIKYDLLQYISTILLAYPILQYGAVIGAVWVLCVELLFYIILIHIKKMKFIHILFINLIVLIIILCQYKNQSVYLANLLYYLKFIPIILIGSTIKITDNSSKLKQLIYITISTLLAWAIIKLCSLVIADESTYTHIETYISALFVFYFFKLLSTNRYLSVSPKFINFINEISYSIYLLQINVGMAFMFYLKCNITNNAYLIIVLSTLLVVVSSAIVHYILELPIQKILDNILIKRRKISRSFRIKKNEE